MKPNALIKACYSARKSHPNAKPENVIGNFKQTTVQEINFRHIATQIGDSLKYSTSVNEIDRIGQSILRVNKENFPNTAITSVRAQSLFNWVLSLAKTPLDNTEFGKKRKKLRIYASWRSL